MSSHNYGDALGGAGDGKDQDQDQDQAPPAAAFIAISLSLKHPPHHASRTTRERAPLNICPIHSCAVEGSIGQSPISYYKHLL